MVRKVCMSCLLVSNNHSDNCKRCNYDEFATIDDYIDQGCLNNDNLSVVAFLRDKANSIEQECNRFNKDWEKLWSSDKDVEFDLISIHEQNDYTDILNNI